jgi:hypothetical protein
MAMLDKRIIPILAAGSEENGVHARTMLAAAEAVGGLSNLADYFKVPRAELFRWAIGIGRPPQALFLCAVELLLDDNRRLRANPGLPRSAASGVASRPGE